MAEENDSAFERWLSEIDPDSTIVYESGDISPSWLSWLRAYFEIEGPESRDVVKAAAAVHQLALARDAAAALARDLHHTTVLRPEVVVDLWSEGWIRISINGGYTTPSMDAMDRCNAYVEVADYFQGKLAQRTGMWPECRTHDAGAHAEAHEGVGVWWCRRGQHVIAPIGELAL